MVDSSKMQKILAKVVGNKHTESEMFLVSLHFAEELESLKTDFGSELKIQLRELVTEFADATQEPQGLPPHRGIFDHTIRLTAYPKRHQRDRLSVPAYEELTRQCTNLFEHGMVRVSNSPYAEPIVIVRKLDGYIRVCVDYKALNGCIVKDFFFNTN